MSGEKLKNNKGREEIKNNSCLGRNKKLLAGEIINEVLWREKYKRHELSGGKE